VRALSDRLNASHVSAIQELQEKNRQLQQAYQELKAAQDQIIEKEKLDRELQLAFEIQMSILPTELPRLEDYNFGALILPARMVGGDFYDLIPLEQDKLGVVVGDVTDKGVPAALFMAQTFALIRSESEKGGSPGEILLRVNRHLLGMNARSLFVTVLFGILDRKDGSFTYARAGHELPLLLAPNGEVAVSPMDIGHPLGILESPMMDENELTIQSAGTLLLYTDGATDGRSPQNERYGMERLKAALKAGMNRSAQELCQDILADIQKHNQSAAQFDDVTLLAVTRSPL
jgi:sigma-B regulation protein RsbU (phosphoserine phosphatase)